jgi:hypothetical protein
MCTTSGHSVAPDAVPHGELFGHQRLEVAHRGDRCTRELPNLADMVLRGLATSHEGNPEHRRPPAGTMRHPIAAPRSLQDMCRHMRPRVP